jgi:hypothetical protein
VGPTDTIPQYADLACSTGWSMMMPVPGLALVWTLLDIAICRFSVLDPIYSLVSSTLLFLGYAISAGMTTAFFAG